MPGSSIIKWPGAVHTVGCDCCLARRPESWPVQVLGYMTAGCRISTYCKGSQQLPTLRANILNAVMVSDYLKYVSTLPWPLFMPTYHSRHSLITEASGFKPRAPLNHLPCKGYEGLSTEVASAAHV